jgi:error-prone DNA polymerase
MSYVELHGRSAFSFLEGASLPEELIAAGLAFDMPAMALLDRDGVYGAPRFHLSAKKNGLKAHIGAEISVKTAGVGLGVVSIPVLVKNRTGYQNLCRLITRMKLRVPKHARTGECAVTGEELAEHAKGLICLTGIDDGPLGSIIEREDPNSAKHVQRSVEWLLDVFGRKNVYAELQYLVACFCKTGPTY